MALRLTNGTSRTRIFQSPLGTVDNLQVLGSQRTTGPSGFSPDFQVCLPYQGVFVWHVAGDDVVGEANQVLYVSGGEAYRISQPTGHGYGELIITPTLRLLSDLACTAERRLSAHPLFVRRSQRANLRLQNLRSRFLHVAMNRNQDGLAAEELLTDLLRNALESQVHQPPLGPATRELVRRTKLFVEACSFSPLRLHDVAQAVGASPAYLTNVFRRAEGVPLHRYLVQLRLANALVELPHANDLTELALGLGFSSHSHFAAAFRRAFGCTPSAFRGLTRDAQQARIGRSRRR